MALRSPTLTLMLQSLDERTDMVVVRGELDIATVGQLSGALDNALRGRAPGVVLDLVEVEYIDSIALAAIIGAWRSLARDGRRLVLVCATAIPRRLLTVTRTDELIEVCGSRSEALALLNASE